MKRAAIQQNTQKPRTDRVLLLDGHTIQVLPFLESLSKMGKEVTIFCETRLSYGYFSRYRKQAVICPKLKNNFTAYYTFLERYLHEHPQDVIIPLFNDSAEFASQYKPHLLALGCAVEIPDWETFIQAHDKERLMEICRRLEIPHPRTANPRSTDFEAAIAYVGYPCLIKPNIGAGAKGIKLVRSKADFEANYDKIVAQFGDATIQEFIPQHGKQLKVQIYRADDGRIVASSCYEKCRYYPIDGGTSTCNRIIERRDLVERYAKILDHIGWSGIADFDCIEDPRTGEILLMEINPRVPGTIKATFLAGIDLAEIIITHASGADCYKPYSYRTGFFLRNLATEILWFAASDARFRTTPSWFRFFGSKIYYVDGSWRDPMPFFAGFLGGLVKWIDPEFRKSKKK